MKNKFFALSIALGVILSLFSGLVLPVSAQGVVTPTPTATPVGGNAVTAHTPTVVPGVGTPTITPVTGSISNDPNVVSFEQISQTEIQLIGPYQTATQTFALPANWQLSSLAKLDLQMAVSFNQIASLSAAALASQAPVMQGGTLTLRINGITVGVLPLNKVGEVSQVIDIPDSALVGPRTGGRMNITYTLDSGISCYVSQQMMVYIHTSSKFILPHNYVKPNVSLLDFPQPLYQGSILPESALVVVPDKPSAAELQAAMTVAAGLGNLTGDALALDITTTGKLTPEQQQQVGTHLILVGKAASLPMLNTLPLPLLATGGQFGLDPASPDNGVVQEINAPWGNSQVVMVVSGNTDAGVIKAAQTLTTGVFRTNTSPNLAIIEQVVPNPVRASVPVDQTLGEIYLADTGVAVVPGRALRTITSINVSTASYRFYMPPGQTVTPDAYFDLIYGNSSLLNYSRSGIVILINGQPIGSVRMSDETASKANNHVQITIPSTVILPGNNRLDIRTNLIPNDACINPLLSALWVSIWPNSTLHMPLTPSQVTPIESVDLAAYPAPFIYQPTLGTTAFALPHDDLVAWHSALQMASFLGSRTNGALFTLGAFYGDEVNEVDRAKYNFIVIGQPSKMPIVSDMNANLPAPFDPGSDVAKETNMQVKFNIPASAPNGYVELLTSPWNKNNLVVAALGNSPEGVLAAGTALVDVTLRDQLAGNFAAISGTQVVTADTRLSPYAEGSQLSAGNTTPLVNTTVDLTPPPANRPNWIMPAIYAALGVVLFVLLVLIVNALMGRGKTRKS